MIDDIMFSRNGQVNPLFIKYRDRLKKYQTEDRLDNSKVLDYLVSLHFCLEYQINNFFRDYFIFLHPHTFSNLNNLGEFINWYLDGIIFWQKITMFFYFNPVWQDDTIEFMSLIKKIKSFSWVRNSILHWSDLYSNFEHLRFLEHENNFEEISSWKTYSFSKEDCAKQKDLYEKILEELSYLVLKTSIWVKNKNKVLNLLKSIFEN